MPSFRDGQANILGITNPGVYVDVIPPTPFLTGVPTNIEGLVGVASWGPVGTPTPFSTPDNGVGWFGLPMVRPYDMMTHVYAATQVGGQVNFMGVRVSDGTDVAASATVQTTGGTATAKYTGTRGNAIVIGFQQGSAIGSFAGVVSFPGRAPERFDNLTSSLAQLTVTAGTGYTSIPGISFPSAVLAPGGILPAAAASLAVISAAVGAGGAGNAVNDVITFSNGVQLKVTAVTTGAVTAFSVQNAGALTGPVGTTIPTNPVAMVSTTGAGTGVTATLTWGLGAATITEPGLGVSSIGSATLTGGAGTGGSYAATISFWASFARAVNLGTPVRGPSAYIMFSNGSSTAAPTLNAQIALTGGADGAANVSSAQMLGQDTLPRKGMYALRNSKCDGFGLCDVTDTTTWAAQLAFATSETMWCALTRPSGGSIADAVSARQTAALDDVNYWLASGDWPSFYDTQNGFARLVSPQAFMLGLAGNLSPEQSPINKPVGGVVATQTSTAGLIIADADESVANNGGIDVLGRSAALNETFFSFLTGRNGSSNTAASGMEYTRLTNFLARALQGAATRSIVGKLQSIRTDDPTRQKAKFILDSFFQALKDPSVGSGGYGLIDDFAVQCDLNNNPPNLQVLGFLFAYCTVRYLNVVRYFVIKLAGGGNVQVTVQQAQPSPQQFAS